MTRGPLSLSSEVRELLERERAIPAQTAAVRARAMARARTALPARDGYPAAGSSGASGGSWTRRLAAAVALACIASAAAGAAAAYGLRARLAVPRNDGPAPAALVPASSTPRARSAVRAPETTAAPEAAAPVAQNPTPTPTPVTELGFLRRARAAVAREDFEAALPPLDGHARRFKHGRLAEEREALRVKTLAGLGRDEEARRAARAFEAHFPHSVLLDAVGRIPAPVP